MEYRLRPHPQMPRIYLYQDPVDFRKSFRSLAAIVEQELGHNPFEGALYAFTNRRRDKIKLCIGKTMASCSITRAWPRRSFTGRVVRRSWFR